MAEKPTAANSDKEPQEGDKIKIKPRIIVQAGAAYLLLVDEGKQNLLLKQLSDATKEGFDLLRSGSTAVDAVEKVVCLLEDNEYFNCGRGSFLNKEKEVECDALIMDGSTLNTGAVMAARHFKHPVSISRKIMEESVHCALNGDGALKFARKNGCHDLICEPEDLIVDHVKEMRGDFPGFVDSLQGNPIPKEHDINHDTVSAVALDRYDNFACATSTGGIPGKLKGRIGDAPLVGCGAYANKLGAATVSGHGEALMKMTLAREIVFNMEKLGQDAREATKNAVKKMVDSVPNGYSSAIAIDKDGNFGRATNSIVILWAEMADDKIVYGMERGRIYKYDEN